MDFFSKKIINKSDFTISKNKSNNFNNQLIQTFLEAIKKKILKPGDKLPTEQELANHIGVGRPNIREVLSALSMLGVVKTKHGSGTYISDLDTKTLLEPLQFSFTLNEENTKQLYDFRSMLEGEICFLAAKKITPQTIALLKIEIQKQKELINNPSGYRESDFQFHSLIWNSIENAVIMRVANSLNILGLKFRTQTSETVTVLHQSIKDHELIVTALETKNRGLAKKAGKQHMKNVFKTTIQSINQK